MNVAISPRVTLVALNSERWGKCSLRCIPVPLCHILTRLPHYLSAPGDVTWRSPKGHDRQEYESHRRLQPLWSKSNRAHAKVNAMCLTVLILVFQFLLLEKPRIYILYVPWIFMQWCFLSLKVPSRNIPHCKQQLPRMGNVCYWRKWKSNDKQWGESLRCSQRQIQERGGFFARTLYCVINRF